MWQSICAHALTRAFWGGTLRHCAEIRLARFWCTCLIRGLEVHACSGAREYDGPGSDASLPDLSLGVHACNSA